MREEERVEVINRSATRGESQAAQYHSQIFVNWTS